MGGGIPKLVTRVAGGRVSSVAASGAITRMGAKTRPAVVFSNRFDARLFPEYRDYARSAMRFEAETQSVVMRRLRRSTMVVVVNRIKIRPLTELVEQGGDGALRHRELSTVFFQAF